MPTLEDDRDVAPPALAERRHLRAGELAEVAVLGDIALVFEVLGWFLPFPFGGAMQVMTIVPIALLATRHRARAAIVATVVIAATGLIVGGLGLVIEAWLYGSLGISIGIARRRGWGTAGAVLLATLTTGLPAVVAGDVAMAILKSLRKLLLAQINILGRGASHILAALHMKWPSRTVAAAVGWVNAKWWISFPAVELVAIAVIAGLAAFYLGPLLGRLERESVPAERPALADETSEPGEAVAPVPVALERVSYSYPGADTPALSDFSADIRAGGLTALVGPNGSGKSTIARILAGLRPASGTVRRPGAAGLGEPGGTAMIFQRPESQVLGVRARDDLVWGLPPTHECDVDSLLGRVGLAGMAERETSTMSGGELQRLAIASALARSPQLIISDESTSMLDSEGRDEVVRLLSSLGNDGTSIVHVTHRLAEVEAADQVLGVNAGRAVPPAVAVDLDVARPGRPRLEHTDTGERQGEGPADLLSPAGVSLRGVGHVYAKGTPWAHRALSAVDLDISPGEGVVVTGPNGSGKSTLAWILAGLFSPSEGDAHLGDEPIFSRIGEIGLGFQHARLQLLRPTVLADVKYGVTEEAARDALVQVGFDPDEMGSRRVDALSGGEQRRVALAGILARRPALVVLDEPLAGLDASTREILQEVLAALRRDRGVATVVVSHDLDAAVLGDRLVRMTGGRMVGDDRTGAGTR
ncbi:MAG TPA: ATP-binding cassette domain-containing protein [Acidimicrobiales bacterium]|nr:ATP-binding cassette domain-containing protein [Acidimicrobiales bacterium]